MNLLIQYPEYAPEQARAFFIRHGRALHNVAAPRCKSRAEVYRLWNWSPVKSGIYARVNVQYPAPYEYLNRVYQGYTPSRADALAFKRGLHTRHHGGPLIDGSTLPDPVITLKCETVGA